MAKDVRCSVTTCAYHDSNNKCLANEIKEIGRAHV